MITLLSSPGDVSLSRNPVLFVLRATDGGGNAYGATGFKARILTTASFKLTAGDTIVFAWTDADTSTNSITFTAVASPSGETDLPDNTTAGFGSFSSYWTEIARILQAHHQIAPFFVITSEMTGPGFALDAESLDTGTEGDFSDSVLTNIYHSFTTIPAVADTTPSGHKVLVDVFVERTYQSGDFELTTSLSEKIDTEGNARFDIQDILNSVLWLTEPDLPIPTFNATDIYLAGTTRRFYIRYRESYDDATVTWSYSPIKKVLQGGIAQSLWNDYDFFSALGPDNSLLTWYPDGKTVDATQPEHLFWYNYDNVDHELVLELTTTDQSGDEDTSYLYTGNGVVVEPGEAVVIPIGVTQLNIVDNAVCAYRVRIVEASSDYEGGSPAYISQLRTYQIDRTPRFSVRYLMYLNGFGLPETVRCVGAFSSSLQVDRIMSNTTVINDASSYDRTMQAAYDFRNIFTYRTAFLRREEVDSLQELMIYARVYEVYEEGFIRLSLTENKFDIYDTRDFLNAVKISTIPTMALKSYSNIIVAMEEAQTGWRTALGTYWQTAFGETWKLP